ncbi:MAG: histidine--tRNA ligase [Candidatus Curtissbacteria bacterium]|nr:histidine--tRNA ligase [Candidatus Curtissbacteria bacterium]
MQKAPPTPKGFRDLDPDVAKKRRTTINKIADVLEEFGFVPIETPTVEFAETLTGKYGEEEKLIYKFTDRGGRDLALRYDLTVPLARYVANNQQLLKPTFSRYQIGQVFRGENPQHGRYREFTQFDFDTVGQADVKEDAKIIAAAIKATKAVGLKTAVMIINDRKNFEGVPNDVVVALDKIHKIERAGVEAELKDKGYSQTDIDEHLNKILNSKPTEELENIFSALKVEHQLAEDDYIFDNSLARGLDYYTGTIFELKPNKNIESLSIGSGGRYDNLVGMFAKKDIPAVGFSFGVDRLVESIE